MKRVSRFWAGAGIWDGRCTCTEAGGASPPLSWLEKLATLLGPSTGTVTQCVDKPQPCGARYWWLQGACLGTRRRITGHGARSWTPPEPPQCIPADLSDWRPQRPQQPTRRRHDSISNSHSKPLCMYRDGSRHAINPISSQRVRRGVEKTPKPVVPSKPDSRPRLPQALACAQLPNLVGRQMAERRHGNEGGGDGSCEDGGATDRKRCCPSLSMISGTKRWRHTIAALQVVTSTAPCTRWRHKSKGLEHMSVWCSFDSPVFWTPLRTTPSPVNVGLRLMRRIWNSSLQELQDRSPLAYFRPAQCCRSWG